MLQIKIVSLIEYNKVPAEDIAILYRVNKLSKDYSKELFSRGIEVNVVNGMDFIKGNQSK